MDRSLLIGLICGTSLDGIDAVFVEVEARDRVKLLASHCADLSPELVQRLKNVSLGNYAEVPSGDPIHELASLDRIVGREFARAVKELLQKWAPEGDTRRLEKIRAIGSLGINIRHFPPTKTKV